MDQNIQKILEIKNKKMQKAFNQNHIELLFLDNKQELLNQKLLNTIKLKLSIRKILNYFLKNSPIFPS